MYLPDWVQFLLSQQSQLPLTGKENVQHKPVIQATDLAKIRASPFLSMTTPAGLLRRTWFYVSLYWSRRGREGQRDLRRDSFKFTHDANCLISWRAGDWHYRIFPDFL